MMNNKDIPTTWEILQIQRFAREESQTFLWVESNPSTHTETMNPPNSHSGRRHDSFENALNLLTFKFLKFNQTFIGCVKYFYPLSRQIHF